MNEQIFFVLLPMIGVPLISLIATWIQYSVTQCRRWMIVRTIEAIKKDLETSTDKVIALEKEMGEFREQMDAELPAWENVPRTILPDTPTLEQAQVAHEEAKRVKDRAHEAQQKLASFAKELYSLRKSLVSRDDRLRALRQKLNRNRS